MRMMETCSTDPKYYSQCPIQPIQYITGNGFGFAHGAVIKYLTRWRDKNGAEDLKKALRFCEFLLMLKPMRPPTSDEYNNANNHLDPECKIAINELETWFFHGGAEHIRNAQHAIGCLLCRANSETSMPYRGAFTRLRIWLRAYWNRYSRNG